MIRLSLTDGQRFSYEFSARSAQELADGAAAVFRRMRTDFAERHLASQRKLSSAIAEIDAWERAKLVGGHPQPEAIRSQANHWRYQRSMGIFYGKKDPDFFLTPNHLELQCLDPARHGIARVCIAQYAPRNISTTIYRTATDAATDWYEAVYLGAPSSLWEALFQKASGANDHAMQLAAFCQSVAGMVSDLGSPAKVGPKLTLIKGGKSG